MKIQSLFNNALKYPYISINNDVNHDLPFVLKILYRKSSRCIKICSIVILYYFFRFDFFTFIEIAILMSSKNKINR